MPKIQVFDARGKFAYECQDDEAQALIADGRAVRRFESEANERGERVFHLQLTTRLNAPNWIFGTRYTTAERMSNGLVVHSPKRAAASLIVGAIGDPGEMIDHAQCCLALDEEAKVESLPSKKAAVFLLVVIWGYTVEEAAQKLGLPKATAGDYFCAVKDSIRRRIESEKSSDKIA